MIQLKALTGMQVLRLRQVFTVLVTAISVFWVAWLLTQAWPELAMHRADIVGTPLVAGFILSMLSAYVTFGAFVILVRRLGSSPFAFRELAHLYFTAQLLKHLPGRVWGLGYQLAAVRSAGSVSQWLLANVALMLLATFFALWSAAITMAMFCGPAPLMLAIMAGLLTCLVGWASLSSRKLGNWLRRWTGRVGRHVAEIFDRAAAIPNRARLMIVLLLCAGSLAYYASWYQYGLAYIPLGGIGGLRMCALYSLAWFVGYVSLLTPAGIGIRELIFVWLAKDFSPDAVALMAVVGRVSLLGVDVVLGLTFASFAPKKP